MANMIRLALENIAAIFLSILFAAMGGVTKLAGAQLQRDTFAHYGYPLWMMYALGVAELCCGGMILFGRLRFAAAIMMIYITLGVVFTMARAGELSWQAIGSPAVIAMAAAGFVAWSSVSRRQPLPRVGEADDER